MTHNYLINKQLPVVLAPFLCCQPAHQLHPFQSGDLHNEVQLKKGKAGRKSSLLAHPGVTMQGDRGWLQSPFTHRSLWLCFLEPQTCHKAPPSTWRHSVSRGAVLETAGKHRETQTAL